MRIIYLLLFFTSLGSSADAQTLEEGAWTDFTGMMGNKPCQLSLYLFKDSTIKGNYVFKYDSVKHNLTGRIKRNDFLLEEDDHKNIIFQGKAITDPTDELQGTMTDSFTNKTMPFGFQSVSTNWGEYGRRYVNAGSNETDAEDFMRATRRAILNSDKKWLANHIEYPVRHVLKKGYPLIKNKQLFIKYFDQIFTPKFKSKIREAYTTNLFTRHDAIMLGDGEIWISGNSDTADEKSGFVIIAINN